VKNTHDAHKNLDDVTCAQCREVLVARMVNKVFAPSSDQAAALVSFMTSEKKSKKQ
jgi:hypothetical protein